MMILAVFFLAAAMNMKAFAAAAGPRMGKHHGSEGRRSPKIAPRKCLT